MRLKGFYFSRFIGLGITAVLLCAPAANTQSPESGVPSLAAIKSLSFKDVNASSQPESVGYLNILDVITACKAYARGLGLLPQYHEPVLTRGAQGVALYRRVSPSIVLVMTGNLKDEKLTDVAIGTGAIVASEGYVLTNWHVIAGQEVGIIFFKPAVGTEPADQSAFGAKLIAQDPVADLALLKILKAPAGLIPLKLGDMSNVQVAEDIHIIGHPHGLFWSYSTGVISQVRDNYKWTYDDGSKHSAKVLQMQTAINPGNSGGPVLDDNGNILGLVAMSEAGQNLDYAIAVDEIKAFIIRAANSATRGTKERTDPPIEERLAATTQAGLNISKCIYKDMSIYYVRDAKDSLIGLIAEQTDGTKVNATKPNGFGGFGSWEVKLPSGKKIIATASGLLPDSIQAEKP
jgi:S1-C subfamily serine protease